jgi:hypothetical protein
MNSRELWTRLRAGLKAGQFQFQAGNGEWRSDVGAPPFKLKGMWETQTASGARECWRVSFSCHHRPITVETRKPRPKLWLVGSKAS